MTSIELQSRPIDKMIRVHTSDRMTFKHCRRRWDWTSPLRSNLRPKISYFGVSFPLWFGTIIHRSLEYHYDPTLKRDTVEVFQTEYQSSLRQFQNEAPDYCDEYADEFRAHYEMGMSMLTNYKAYAAKHDDFDVIAAEQSFEVYVGFVENGTTFHSGPQPALPIEEWPTNMQPVYYCGRMDAVVRDRATGRYGIIDHKTTNNFADEFFDKLDMDEQCTSYMWAAQEYAKEHDLPYKQIDFVIYNALRKCTLKPPTLLEKTGRLSINRASEACTYEMFMQAVKENNLAWQLEDPKVQGYVDWLREEGDSLFIRRAVVRRNQTEIDNLAARVQLEIADMFGASIYPNPTGDWYCLRCPFRSPCLAANDGSDYGSMLEANYVQNMVEGRYTAY